LAQFNISALDVENWGAMFLPKEVIDLTTLYLTSFPPCEV
jgi:hypothetical protein